MNLPIQLRETAEDLSIKSKFKSGQKEQAISDYENMYQLNGNSPKGVHAKLNMECLISILNDTLGLNRVVSEQFRTLALHKRTILLLTQEGVVTRRPDPGNLPIRFQLYQNYPNPFNPNTTISFDLPVSGHTTLFLYDITGKIVKELVDAYKPAGNYTVKIDGSNLASGVYFYRLLSGNYSQTKKMVLIK